MNNSTLHPLSRVLPARPIGPMRVPARMLAWFSIGVGMVELAMPRTLARITGMPNLPTLTRACGLREIGTGIAILTAKDPSPWLWGRVAGDALDIATAGAGLLTERRPLRTLATITVLLGVAYVDKQVAEAAPVDRKRAKRSLHDYSARSGFPRPAEAMRGIGLKPSSKIAPAGAPRKEAPIPMGAGLETAPS